MTNRECLDAIAALALGLPPGSQLAIGSRDALPLPAARLRAQGGIVEIGVDDLAMDADEAAVAARRAAGVELAEADVRELVAPDRGLAGRPVPRRARRRRRAAPPPRSA